MSDSSMGELGLLIVSNRKKLAKRKVGYERMNTESTGGRGTGEHWKDKN